MNDLNWYPNCFNTSPDIVASWSAKPNFNCRQPIGEGESYILHILLSYLDALYFVPPVVNSYGFSAADVLFPHLLLISCYSKKT